MTKAHLPPSRTAHHQHGVALFVVIVVVLLSSLLVMWGARTSLFNELVVGNDADYQRAFAAAQSLIQDAELDIRSAEPDTNNKTADGVDCSPGGDICRMGLSDYQIPASRENEKVGILLAKLATSHSNTEGCQKGLCIKRTGKQDFWNDTATLAKMANSAVGARYGQFTGAAKGSSSAPANPILADTSAANKGGWYWIEIMPYIKPATGGNGLIVNASATSSNEPELLRPNLDPNVAYRITALAYGLKGSMVVVQETYAQQRRKD